MLPIVSTNGSINGWCLLFIVGVLYEAGKVWEDAILEATAL